MLAQQPPAAAEVLLRRAAEVGASVAREGLEFGVLSRELAVGGQQVAIRGLLGDYPDLYLPLFGAHQAGNLACAIAAVEAFARTPETPTQTASGDRAAGRRSTWTSSARGGDDDLARPAGDRPAQPGGASSTPAHNPGGMAASVEALTEAFSFTDLIAILAVSEDKDVSGILDELEPVVAQLVATTNSSPRSMPTAALADAGRRRVRAGPGHGRRAAGRRDRAGRALADEADAAGEGGPGQGGRAHHRLGDHRRRCAGAAVR